MTSVRPEHQGIIFLTCRKAFPHQKERKNKLERSSKHHSPGPVLGIARSSVHVVFGVPSCEEENAIWIRTEMKLRSREGI